MKNSIPNPKQAYFALSLSSNSRVAVSKIATVMQCKTPKSMLTPRLNSLSACVVKIVKIIDASASLKPRKKLFLENDVLIPLIAKNMQITVRRDAILKELYHHSREKSLNATIQAGAEL